MPGHHNFLRWLSAAMPSRGSRENRTWRAHDPIRRFFGFCPVPWCIFRSRTQFACQLLTHSHPFYGGCQDFLMVRGTPTPHEGLLAPRKQRGIDWRQGDPDTFPHFYCFHFAIAGLIGAEGSHYFRETRWRSVQAPAAEVLHVVPHDFLIS